MLAIIGFLYPFVWLFAGIYGSEWGRSEAKEFFTIFGYMGEVYLVSMIWVLVELLKSEKFALNTQLPESDIKSKHSCFIGTYLFMLSKDFPNR